MVDLTKCKGEECPMKDQCYRFTSLTSQYRQSWFLETPFKDGACEHFMQNQPTQKFDQEHYETYLT